MSRQLYHNGYHNYIINAEIIDFQFILHSKLPSVFFLLVDVHIDKNSEIMQWKVNDVISQHQNYSNENVWFSVFVSFIYF